MIFYVEVQGIDLCGGDLTAKGTKKTQRSTKPVLVSKELT